MFPSLPPFHDTFGRWARAVVVVAGLVSLSGVAHAESPGLDAIEEFKTPKESHPAVDNRFFLKENRFEFSPMVGYVPNNPYAKRYVGGVQLGYHFGETISAQAQVFYSPDLNEGDVKGLVEILLDKAYNGGGTGTNDDEFQQPLDKVGLGADFGLAWAPFYGKINLVGETVLNMDVYFYGGAGMVSKKNYVAKYDENAGPTDNNMLLEPGENEVKVAPYIGLGQNYFLNRLLALKLDVRAAFYVDNKPQYHESDPVTEQRLYNNVIASGGFAFFFPNMKPRLYEF